MQFAKRHILKATLVVVLLLVFVVPSFASATNGSFETGDFTGWGTATTGDAIFVATSSPGIGGGFLPSDGITDGIYAAYFDSGGPTAAVLYQNFTVPTGGSLSLDLTYGNGAGAWFWTGALDESGAANQHIRIDIMDPASADFSMAAGDIYMTVFASSATTPLTADKQSFSADLSAYAGQTVRVRVAKVDNQNFFPVVVDNLVVTTGGGGLNVPHITDVKINAGANVPAYADPGGEQAKLADGTDLFLPWDSGQDGADTYIVTDTVVIDGTTWYSIFIGNQNFVWVSGPLVIPQ